MIELKVLILDESDMVGEHLKSGLTKRLWEADCAILVNSDGFTETIKEGRFSHPNNKKIEIYIPVRG